MKAAVGGSALDIELERARKRYAAARPVSEGQAAMASNFLPAGSTRSVLDFPPFPFRVAEAYGARLIDVDGHEYVDLLGDYTAGLLGHNPAPVADAVTKALARGWSLGAIADEEHLLAEELCNRFPSLQLMRFTNSGSEANLMAIGVARHHTGRSKVLVFDGAYHGGPLYFGKGGEALLAPFEYVRCPFNDLDAVTRALAEHLDIACILVEPMMGSGGCIPGRHDFLAGLRDVCRDTGVVLIFDEVMTSRMSIGGAQRRLAVRPDLTTLGKYLGGGFSFGAFGGRADIMSAFDPARGGTLTHGGTFNNNVATMTAGLAAVEMLTPEALDELFDLGESTRFRLAKVAEPFGLSVTGWGSLMNLHATAVDVRRPADLEDTDPRIGELLFLNLLERGFYIAPRGFIALSLAVSHSDVEAFAEAFDDSLGHMVEVDALAAIQHQR